MCGRSRSCSLSPSKNYRGEENRNFNRRYQCHKMERMSVMANQKQSNERRCILKPQYEIGEEVYAAWMGVDRAGRVETYREVVTAVEGEDSGGGAYGPIRLYQIKFDTDQMPLPKMGMPMAMDGSVVDGIPEHVVVSKRDYLLFTSHGVGHEWKGVRNVFDKSSDDLWAKNVGWYAVVIGGRGEGDAEQCFSRLSDAVRAYDASVVRIKGDKTERGELNLPGEWNWLFTTSSTVEHYKELLQEKELLQCKSDDIYKQEKELAIKVMLDDERLKHLNMQIKLREELRESYNKDMEVTKKIYEEEKDLAMEKARGGLLLQHQHEKEKLRAELKEYYADEMVKAVEEAKAKLRKEMQLEIDREKDKALNWLRVKVMQQQRQQNQQRKVEAGANGLDPANKTLVRARDSSDDTSEVLTASKRVKLEESGRDFGCPAAWANGFRVVSLTTKQGEKHQGRSINLDNAHNESSQLSSPNGGSCQHFKTVPKELVVLSLPSPPCLPPVAQAKAEIVDCEITANHHTAADEEPSKDPHGHITAVEALLFAAEKMESRIVSAESWIADPSTEEYVPAAIYVTTSSKNSSPQSPDAIKKKKKPKRTMDTSCAIEPTDEDVLFGRGGYVNTHPGNIQFREKALELRPWYEASSKEEKYNISKVLIESVKGQGHRFLEKASDGLWHEVSGNGVRKKASQALRERVRGKMLLSTPTKQD